VDVTYRSDRRQLNELNFARFDATVEQLGAWGMLFAVMSLWCRR
jgi:hypothetical protein